MLAFEQRDEFSHPHERLICTKSKPFVFQNTFGQDMWFLDVTYF